MLSLLLHLTSSNRITRKQQVSLNYTTVPKNQIATWIAKNPNCVVVYADSYKVMKPLRFAIEDNSNFTAFALTEPNPETNEYCIAYPCASAYLKGRHVRSTISDFSPMSFQFWVTHSISEPHFDIGHPEEFRRLLELPGNHFIAVDTDKRPSWVPKDQVLFHVSKKVISRFTIPQKPGIYVFRHIDREFIALESWDTTIFKSKLLDIGVDKFRSTKYIAGSIINNDDDYNDKLKLDLMKNMSDLYQNKVAFTAYSSVFVAHIAQIANITNICGPLFLVVETSNISAKRYGLATYGQTESMDSLKEYLDKVISGQVKPIVAEDIRTKERDGVNELSVLDYTDKLWNKDYNSLVIITSTCVGVPVEYSTVFNVGSQIYKEKNLKLWAFDQGRNDVPAGINIYNSYPQILVYPAKSNQYKVFEKAFTLPNLEKFINQNTGISLNETEKEKYQADVLIGLSNPDTDETSGYNKEL